MSLHLPPRDPTAAEAVPESGSESSESDNDQAFSDWDSDGDAKIPCKSLFDETTLPTAHDVQAHDAKVHGFDLEGVGKRIGLDFHGRVRLINWIRTTKPTPQEANDLTGQEAFLTADEYLKPVLQDDPLLQLDFDEPWSEDDDQETTAEAPGSSHAPTKAPTDLSAALKKIHALEKKLSQTTSELSEVRSFVTKRLDSELFTSDTTESVTPAPRDDDSHYFESYGSNEIHQIMIQDKVRTSTYANFILSNPQLFRDAVVLDVGCGTGILSLFAARAGAKKVFAVDASPIAEKARAIVKANNCEDVITVIQGKVEDVKLDLPEGHTGVDIIVSEWMGYALLYESMLDSVLVARDRFLRPGGLLAPNQSRMKLALADGADIHKERVEFWSDVYGFDLSNMVEPVYTDAAVEIVPEASLLSEPITIKDIHIPTATVHTLSFSAPFTLVSTSARRKKCRAIVLYFDTFFPGTPEPIKEDEPVHVTRQDEVRLAEVWSIRRRPSTGEGVAFALPAMTPSTASSASASAPLSKMTEEPGTAMESPPPLPRKPSLKRPPSERKDAGVTGSGNATDAPVTRSPPTRSKSLGPPKPETMTSFSTGPASMPTHWKQTVFLLREPINVREGTIVTGTFFCRKDPENKRELNIEIHYEVQEPDEDDVKGKENAKGRVVQSYKVR